ncbi:hypothetical protein FACS189465_0900 [Clostridia bacterium]|nr:hypothetical protein FACS189465_0900 [Clostridia bacterium]
MFKAKKIYESKSFEFSKCIENFDENFSVELEEKKDTRKTKIQKIFNDMKKSFKNVEKISDSNTFIKVVGKFFQEVIDLKNLENKEFFDFYAESINQVNVNEDPLLETSDYLSDLRKQINHWNKEIALIDENISKEKSKIIKTYSEKLETESFQEKTKTRK